VENPLLEAVKHADLHFMEEVAHWEIIHNTENMSKHVESSVTTARGELANRCLGVRVAEPSISVVIPPGVFLVRTLRISKFIL
jgi:hypothetical protein